MTKASREALGGVVRTHTQTAEPEQREVPVQELNLSGGHFTLGGEPIFPYALIEAEGKEMLVFADVPTVPPPDLARVKTETVLCAYVRRATNDEIKRDLGGNAGCAVVTILALEVLEKLNGDFHFGPSQVSRAYPHLIT